jgi:RNase H-fold protein (predicted Holliday junction resolvase)
MNNVYIGLDVSTSVIGIAGIDENKNIVFLESFKFPMKEKDLLIKGKLFAKKLLSLKEKYNIVKFGIEDNLNSYQQTSKITLIKLAKINGIISFQLLMITNTLPDRLNPLTARKIAFGKAYDKKNFSNSKEYVLYKLLEIYGEEELSKYLYKDKKENIAKECYDFLDALVIALATLKK